MSTEMTKRPFMDFAAMRERLDRLFEDVTGVRHADGSWSMAMDVHRSDDALTLRADVPGLEPDDIKITVEDGVLTVSGERHYGSFRRTLALPPEAKAGGENTAGLIIDSKMHAGWIPEPAPLTTTG